MQLGPYEILGEVARGGIGVLYKARDPRGSVVAIKLLQVEGASTKRRFGREVRSMAQVQHPNVARYLDAGEAQGHPYLVMEFVEGRSLEDRLRLEGPLPVPEVRRIGAALCDALEAVHARGLVHRDLKPANVLEGAGGRVVLTDFGLVKQDDDAAQSQTLSLTVRGGFLGTPGFWPPEQARGRVDLVGPASDVYALAATLYALLCGSPPRGGATLVELLSLVEAPVTSLKERGVDLPPGVDRMLLRCLAVDPAKRPSLNALRIALTRDRAPNSAAKRGASPALLAGLSALSLLLALGLGVAVWTRGDGEPTPSNGTGLQPGEDPPPLQAAELERLTAQMKRWPGLGPTVEVGLPAWGSHMSMIADFAYDPRSGRVLSATVDGELRLWDVRSGRQLQAWYDAAWGGVVGVDFGPRGHLFGLTRSGTLLRIDPSGELSTQRIDPKQSYLDANARGELVTCGSGGLQLWSVAQALGDVPPPPRAAPGSFAVARFHPKAGGLAVGRKASWRWDAEGRGEAAGIEGTPGTDLAFSPDGKHAAIFGPNNTLILYSWPELKRLGEQQVYTPPANRSSNDHVRGLCFSADGARVYTVGSEPWIRAWAVPSLNTLDPLPLELLSWTQRVQTGPEGTLLAGGNEGRLMLLSLAEKRPLWTPPLLPALLPRGKAHAPAWEGLSWLDTSGAAFVLNTRDGPQLLDIASGQRLRVTELAGSLQVAAAAGQIYGIRGGKLLRVDTSREGGRLSVAEPKPVPMEKAVEPTDLALQDGNLYVSAQLRERRGYCGVWEVPLPWKGKVAVYSPFPVGGRPQLGRSLSSSGFVWLTGSQWAAVLPLPNGGTQRLKLSEQPLYVAQFTPERALLINRNGTWRLGDLVAERFSSGSLERPLSAARALNPSQVLLNHATQIDVFDLEQERVVRTLQLPPGEISVCMLPSVENDSLYVWTYRGVLLRYWLD